MYTGYEAFEIAVLGVVVTMAEAKGPGDTQQVWRSSVAVRHAWDRVVEVDGTWYDFGWNDRIFPQKRGLAKEQNLSREAGEPR